LKATYPVYENHANPFLSGNYSFPVYRSPLTQMECIYILKTNNTKKKLAVLIGWGFIFEAFNLYKNI
jgi:hypothetical protein